MVIPIFFLNKINLKMIVFRKREYKGNYWIEYLVVPFNSILILPTDIPIRYVHRIISSNNMITEVKSLYNDTHDHVTLNTILNGNGIWIIASDCVTRGTDLPQFMNIQIDVYCANEILNYNLTLKNYYNPLSLYHGTADHLLQECIKELKPSFGMLGNAIYLGTFWKACRFATRDQTYQIRKGSLLRYLVFSKNMIELPTGNWKCQCDKCINYCWAAHISDHNKIWSLNGDAVHASPCMGIGYRNDGEQKWALKNEEWAIECPILLTHTSDINLETIEPHYDPLARNIFIH